jgi:hypothetical protein
VLVKLCGVPEKQATSLGAYRIALKWYAITPSCVTTLLVCLGIVVTTCYLMIFRTHVFGVYSHIWICILLYLYSYSSIHSIFTLAANSTWQQLKVHLKMMIQWTQRYTRRP